MEIGSTVVTLRQIASLSGMWSFHKRRGRRRGGRRRRRRSALHVERRNKWNLSEQHLGADNKKYDSAKKPSQRPDRDKISCRTIEMPHRYRLPILAFSADSTVSKKRSNTRSSSIHAPAGTPPMPPNEIPLNVISETAAPPRHLSII